MDIRMDLEKNDEGVTQFPKGDVRRLLVLLAAIDVLERPTLVNLAAYTGINKGDIDVNVGRLAQYGVVIEKSNGLYSIENWGDILKKGGVKNLLAG